MTPPVCNREERPTGCRPVCTKRRELTQVAVDAWAWRSSPVWRTVAARLLLEHGAKVLDARHGSGWAGGANTACSFFLFRSSFSFLPCTQAEAIRKRAGADQPVLVWKVCAGRHRGEGEKQQEQVALDELLGHIPQGQFSRAGETGGGVFWRGDGPCVAGDVATGPVQQSGWKERDWLVAFGLVSSRLWLWIPELLLHRQNQVGGNGSSSQVVRHAWRPGVGEASAVEGASNLGMGGVVMYYCVCCLPATKYRCVARGGAKPWAGDGMRTDGQQRQGIGRGEMEAGNDA